MDDPATFTDWLTVIVGVFFPGTFLICCVLLLNYCWDHWGFWAHVRWHRLTRYLLWLCVNLSAADAAEDFWLTPPPIPPTRQRR